MKLRNGKWQLDFSSPLENDLLAVRISLNVHFCTWFNFFSVRCTMNRGFIVKQMFFYFMNSFCSCFREMNKKV